MLNVLIFIIIGIIQYLPIFRKESVGTARSPETNKNPTIKNDNLTLK